MKSHEDAAAGGGAIAVAQGVSTRLSVFAQTEVGKILDQVGCAAETDWPTIEGCLVVLFTARSGSTFLCRELEAAFDIGRVGESLNPAKLQKRPATKIVRKLKSSWFAFKAGAPALIAAEGRGFFEAYGSRTSFIRLVRRDIVAQAVSMARASQTGMWHAHRAPARAPEYDRALIAKSLAKIARGVDQLRRYADASGRPHRLLAYEDFANGDLASAVAVGDGLGLPRRRPEDGAALRPVERMGDATNEAWIARFNEDMTGAQREVMQRYAASIGS